SNIMMLVSPQFIELLKDSKFKLKTEDDAIALQTLLCLIDNYKALGYFKEDQTWYFVRDKFFDDTTAYEIVTDKKARIVSITHHSDLKKEVPESFLAAGKKEDFDQIRNTVSEEDSLWSRNYLFQKADYSFSHDRLDLPIDTSQSLADVYHCKLETTEIYSDGVEGTTHYSFMLLSNDGIYEVFQNEEELIKSELFTDSILSVMTIANEEDAGAFQNLMDYLNPVDDSFRFEKEYYQQDGIWIFLRDTRFDDTLGYMVKTDESGAIKYVEYSPITDTDILRFKMKDDDFVVDYKFELLSPTTNKIKLKKGEGLKVQISFDADMVNATGGWIITRFDGIDTGFYASTNMESPYTDELSSEALKDQQHTVEYYLLKSGAEDTDDALAVIKLEIEIE
ncbi:MAG: hypothetical protein RBR29_09560, partial [Castellaniella sp.]|uniref:hypothetical protein n=1 Tax=Castellaniella sp. TaxID=1955812 RepID=UPI002A35B21A